MRKFGDEPKEEKPRCGLVLGDFARALIEVSKVGSFGARKYTDSGWLYVPDGISRYTDAMLRHWLAHQSGELRDPESGELHLAHVAWNALAVLEHHLRGPSGEVEVVEDDSFDDDEYDRDLPSWGV